MRRFCEDTYPWLSLRAMDYISDHHDSEALDVFKSMLKNANPQLRDRIQRKIEELAKVKREPGIKNE